LKGTVGKGKNRNTNIKDFKIDEIHQDYEQLSGEEILKFWDGRSVIRNKSGEIIAAHPSGPGLRTFIKYEYSRAEYYYIQGMLKLDAGKYYEALVDFNTALFIYHEDMFVVEVYMCSGRRRFERIDVYETPIEINGYNNVIGECDIYLNQIKTLQKLGSYKNVIESVRMMMDTEEYNECLRDDYDDFKEFIIEIKKILLDAYIKEKQFDEALRVCDELLEIVDFDSCYNIRIVKSLAYEQMGNYNAALEVIAVDFSISTLLEYEGEFVLEQESEFHDFLDKYQNEYIQANRLGKRLLKTMKDKGITIEVEGFIDDEDEE
jgi:pentatricopeptide repeat protein